MERRFHIWKLIIHAMDSISKDSKYKEVGMNQILSYIKKITFPNSQIIDINSISADEIFLALTEDSDCVELFQFESISLNDIFFSLRDSPENSILKAKKMQNHGIKEILNQNNGCSAKFYQSKANENNKYNHNFLSTNVVASCY